MRTPSALTRRLAGPVLGAMLGAGVLAATTPAWAVTTFSPTSGHDGEQFSFTTDFDCPVGAIELNYAFEGPGSNYATGGEGFVGPDATPDSGGVTIAGTSVANLRTGTATFGTGPYPQTYTLRAFCVDASGTLLPAVDVGTLTILGQGFTGTTWQAADIGGGPTSTATTSSTTGTTTPPGATTTPPGATTPSGATTTTTSTSTSTSTSRATTTTSATSGGAATSSTATATPRPPSTSATGRPLAATGDSAGSVLTGIALALVTVGLALVLTVRGRRRAGTHR